MKYLILEQRCALKAYLQCSVSETEIAKRLGRHKSTIYEELQRNQRKRGTYNPDFAQELSEERKERFCYARKFNNYKKLVEKWIIEEQWSPEQIKGYCDDNDIEMVSHEKIYQYIRNDKTNGGDLYRHLRHRMKHRKRPVWGKHQVIKNKVSIDDRADIINHKERFGNWAIDPDCWKK